VTGGDYSRRTAPSPKVLYEFPLNSPKSAKSIDPNKTTETKRAAKSDPFKETKYGREGVRLRILANT
jgi:hypothetical protein